MKEPDKIIDDPIKSTLFGKFYEKIIISWLSEIKGFTIYQGKPRIYWNDVAFAKLDHEAEIKVNEVLDKYKKEKRFCTPDGFLQKNEEFYIWEAKNWPLWSEGKKPLDQLRDLLCSLPLILASKGVYRSHEYNIDGILFSWWSEPKGATPEDLDHLLKDVRGLIAPRTFELIYTDKILKDCIQNQYPWYLQIIREEQKRVVTLFEDLLGSS